MRATFLAANNMLPYLVRHLPHGCHIDHLDVVGDGTQVRVHVDGAPIEGECIPTITRDEAMFWWKWDQDHMTPARGVVPLFDEDGVQ